MITQARLAGLYAALRRHRAPVLALWAVVLGLAIYGGVRLQLDTSSTAFFPDTPPALGRMARAMDLTPFSQLLFVDLHVAAMPGGDGRAVLAKAADAVLQALPPHLVSRVDEVPLPTPGPLLRLLPAIENGHAVFAELAEPGRVENALAALREQLGGLFGGLGAWSRADPLGLRATVFAALPLRIGLPPPDPVHGYMFSADRQHLLLPLRPASSMHDADGAVALMNALENALRELPSQPVRVTASVVGGHRHTAVNTRVITADIERLVLLSFAGFALVYLLLVRSRSAVWLLAVPALAALCAVGALPLVWPVASGLALGFGASVLGLAEDYAVHVHFTLRAASPLPPERRLARLTPPLVQSLAMNCAGFAVLLFSGLPAVRQLAFFAILSLVAGLVLAFTLLPLCPWQTPPAGDAATVAHEPAGTPQAPVMGRTVAVAACLLLLLGLAAGQVRVDVSPRTLGADMAAMEAETRRFQSVWGGQTETSALVVHAPDDDAALALAAQVAAHVRANGGEATSLSDVLPPRAEALKRAARWQIARDAAAPELVARLKQTAARLGFAGKAFDPFTDWLHQPVEPASPALLAEAGLGQLTQAFLRSGPDGSRALVLAHGRLPALPETWGDAVVLLAPHELESALRAALRHEGRLVPVVVALMALMLVAVLRRPGPVLLAALPPLAAMTGVLGWMAASGTPLTLAAMTALPLTLSLAIDHGLVVTHDLAHGMPLGLERAMLVSSLTSILGMGLLALADHPALRNMGQIIVIGLTLEFVTARWLLPRLCRPVREGSTDAI